MKKFQILGFALIAVFACSAFVSSAAFGLTFELALWLVNGVEVKAELPSVAEGGLLFKSLLNGAELLCEGLFDGTVGPESQDLILEVLTTAGVLVLPLEGEAILCTNVKTCEKAEIWPLKLPWTTEVEQDVQEPGVFYELITGAEYHISCTVLGIKVEELCFAVAGTAGEIKNLTTDVEASTTKVAEPASTCNENPADATVVGDTGNLMSTSEGSLSVSL